MALFPKLIQVLPISAETKMEWHRVWLDSVYAKDIAAARNANDREKVESLERDRQFELELHDEEDDTFLTRALLARARRLRVPTPHRYNDDKTESVHWYEGRYTGAWCLTRRGVAVLREDIRKELKAQHESRAHWVVWISSLTGVIGAITGLVALLLHKS